MAVGFRCGPPHLLRAGKAVVPDPLLGSGFPGRVFPVLAGSGRVALGPMHRQGEEIILAVRCITCGDVNPDCHGLLCPLVSGGLIAGRRLPPCPRFHCFAWFFARKPVSVSGAFSSFAKHFRARRRPIIYTLFPVRPRKKWPVFPAFPHVPATCEPAAS